MPRLARLGTLRILHHSNISLGQLLSGSCRQVVVSGKSLMLTILSENNGRSARCPGHSMLAVFDKSYVKRLEGNHIKKGKTKMDLADQLHKHLPEAISEMHITCKGF